MGAVVWPTNLILNLVPGPIPRLIRIAAMRMCRPRLTRVRSAEHYFARDSQLGCAKDCLPSQRRGERGVSDSAFRDYDCEPRLLNLIGCTRHDLRKSGLQSNAVASRHVQREFPQMGWRAWVAVCALVSLAVIAGCGGGSSTSGSGSGSGMPAIMTPPVSRTVAPGEMATFSATASGTAPLTYQWQKNSTAIAGATSASYTTPPATIGDNGAKFRLVVSNSLGSVTSGEAAPLSPWQCAGRVGT